MNKDTGMASVRNSGKTTAVGLPKSNRMKQFLEETWVELRYKVTWPNPKTQLVRSTSVVLAVVVIVSIYIYLLDIFFAFVLRHTVLAPR